VLIIENLSNLTLEKVSTKMAKMRIISPTTEAILKRQNLQKSRKTHLTPIPEVRRQNSQANKKQSSLPKMKRRSNSIQKTKQQLKIDSRDRQKRYTDEKGNVSADISSFNVTNSRHK
jgi:hypothetical protein